MQQGEQCDDGNGENGDGCTTSCALSAFLLPRCGDGVVQEGEECDRGPENSNDQPGACRTNCADPSCGDGVRDEGEQCDDGNANEYDGCTWRCEVSECGNGIIETLEECDVGSDNSDVLPNACRTVCRKPWCGDGVVDAGEECDDANLDNEDACTRSCEFNCPDGTSKIQGRCIELVAQGEECGVGCAAGKTWTSFVDWLFGLFGA